MVSKPLGDEQGVDRTAVFFLAPNAQQKLEVNYTRGFFKQNYQIVLDGACLETGISEPELEQGKTYPLSDGKLLEIKFLGNRVVVWQDGEKIPLSHEESNRQVDPWESITFAMYGGGAIGFLVGVWQLFPISDVDFLSATFWTQTASFLLLGIALLTCGYVIQHQQKLWAVWLGNGILLVFLLAWFAFVFWIDRENLSITHPFYAAMFIFLAKEQAKNTKKAQDSFAKRQ